MVLVLHFQFHVSLRFWHDVYVYSACFRPSHLDALSCTFSFYICMYFFVFYTKQAVHREKTTMPYEEVHTLSFRAEVKNPIGALV